LVAGQGEKKRMGGKRIQWPFRRRTEAARVRYKTTAGREKTRTTTGSYVRGDHRNRESQGKKTKRARSNDRV